MSSQTCKLEWTFFGSGRTGRHVLRVRTTFTNGGVSLKSTGLHVKMFNGWRQVWKGGVFIIQVGSLKKAKALAEATLLLGEE